MIGWIVFGFFWMLCGIIYVLNDAVRPAFSYKYPYLYQLICALVGPLMVVYCLVWLISPFFSGVYADIRRLMNR